MSRFPTVPGAGAKNIGNPVYWSRMSIQNERYRQVSAAAQARLQERYDRLWDIYSHIWDNFFEDSREFLSDTELDEFGDLNQEFKEIDLEIAESPESVTRASLNKLATRLKNLTLYICNKCIDHDVYSDLHSAEYDSKRKFIQFNGKDMYFIG